MSFWQSFWDIIWWSIWIFAFFAYLWVIIGIVTDLFRDREMNGWGKAVWIIFLLFFPFITALVYLIARGRGMAERAQRDYQQNREATDAYIRQTAGSSSPSDEIAKARSLLDSGTITQQEYDLLKAKALAQPSANVTV